MYILFYFVEAEEKTDLEKQELKGKICQLEESIGKTPDHVLGKISLYQIVNAFFMNITENKSYFYKLTFQGH